MVQLRWQGASTREWTRFGDPWRDRTLRFILGFSKAMQYCIAVLILEHLSYS